MSLDKRLLEASLKTGANLKTIAESKRMREISRLSLPEIQTITDMVSKVVPAGNVPGVILSGLSRLSERVPPPQEVRRDVNLLLKGVEQTLDKAVYLAFFAGPAAAILGYQNLLRVAGKDPEQSFPDGTWQFYVEYALRDDTARHASETHGFDTILSQHRIALSPVDRITAWVMASIHLMHQYPALLENEWRERMLIHLLRQEASVVLGADRLARLYREWEALRPYGRGPDAASDNYPTFRRTRFDRFVYQATVGLPGAVRNRWLDRVREAEQLSLPAFIRQMSILAYLEPGAYDETRVAVPISLAQVAVIYRGLYYTIPACAPGTAQPPDPAVVRAQVAALMSALPDTPPVNLIPLAEMQRSALAGLRGKLDRGMLAELDTLRMSPIVLNCDPRPSDLPLSEIRRAERGVGDHALTVLDTGRSFVFDLSHIFFDGAWGAAFAEIMTNEALSWAVYLSTLPALGPAQASGVAIPRALNFRTLSNNWEAIRQARRVTPEVGVETSAVDLNAILALRKVLKMRNDLLQLTVNDLLVLYRAIHAVAYRPHSALMVELTGLATRESTRAVAMAAIDAIDPARQISPAILIPIDASQSAPRERLCPMTFDVPLKDLGLLDLHWQVIAALDGYERATGDRSAAYAEFDRLQRAYLATLAGFGTLIARFKEMALSGQSPSAATIKMLAHMPAPLQHLLDRMPNRYDVLNDLIKGREVFSNVGAVVRSSTLRRFITAKDDNEKKTLAWGVITDSMGVMHISLRDFRPHVGMLQAAGLGALAARIAQDYVDAYARGLNGFIHDLQRIVITSRETKMKR